MVQMVKNLQETNQNLTTAQQSKQNETSEGEAGANSGRMDPLIQQMLNTGVPLERAMRWLALEKKDDEEFQEPAKRRGRPPNNQEKNSQTKIKVPSKRAPKKLSSNITN